eukprot:6706848-Ditylum_brightwellii.AAC.1
MTSEQHGLCEPEEQSECVPKELSENDKKYLIRVQGNLLECKEIHASKGECKPETHELCESELHHNISMSEEQKECMPKESHRRCKLVQDKLNAEPSEKYKQLRDKCAEPREQHTKQGELY